MRILLSVGVSAMALLIGASPVLAQPEVPRPAVVVVPFETDRTGWMPPPEFGTTLGELLADRLIESGKYRVMDYTWLVDAGPPTGGRKVCHRGGTSRWAVWLVLPAAPRSFLPAAHCFHRRAADRVRR